MSKPSLRFRPARFACAALVLLGTTFIAARRVGSVPALGPFLEPAHGVWSLSRSARMARDASARIPGLEQPVTVVYDARGVPHIFAASEADVYRALGFVIARDRLFQLDLQTRAATGRLTELVGEAALTQDRETRALGLPRSAERKLASAPDTATHLRFARAYAAGINAYVAQMPASELPLEYRLTGTRPPPWTPIDSYHLLNRMGWTLAYFAIETDRAAAASRVGEAAAEALFPAATPIQEPIQPNGQSAPRFDFAPLPAAGLPDTSAAWLAAANGVFMPSQVLARGVSDEEAPRSFASNNWAVSPRRSASGHALLAGDPHLKLSLPSIWYEAHLVVPGVLDVYGVTIPGAPGMVIGFNRDVAWTFTNTGADVLDYYHETVDDSTAPTRYRVDDAWRPLERRIETYRDQRGVALSVDTLYFTHRGPMRRVRNRWLSMRWTVLEGGTELAAFHEVSHATTAMEVQDAMARWYQAPVQNMLAADRAGHIAIRSNGRFPIRADDGRGDRVRDGSRSASDWIGAADVARFPQAIDPAQGFLASANQQPIDSKISDGWWGGSYDPWRAMRINALLRGDSAVTVQAMRAFQTDPGSARADYFAPFFVNAARRVGARGSSLVNVTRLEEAGRLLGEWDRRYARDNHRAELFESAMRELADRTWDELATQSSSISQRVATPSTAVLAGLIADSSSSWWDDRSTPQVELRDDILAGSLVAALQATERRYGLPATGGWRWDRIRHAQINHLLRLPALSALNLPVQGGPATLSPSTGDGTHGASWRMVVELAPEVRAWTTYPGGQSGNPVSPRYRDRIASWVNGSLERVHFPATPAALDSTQRSATLHLGPSP